MTMRRRSAQGMDTPVMYTSEAEQIAREYWELSRSRLWGIRILCLLMAAAIAVGALFAFGVLRLDAAGKKSKVLEFELKDIGELATEAASLSIYKVVEISRQIGPVELPGSKSTYGLTFALVVKAGLDFDQIELNADEGTKTVRLKMPEIRILSAEAYLDDWDDDSISAMSQIGPDEMEAVRNNVIAEARKIAEERGTLSQARENAEKLVRGLLAGGYDPDVYKVDFQWP